MKNEENAKKLCGCAECSYANDCKDENNRCDSYNFVMQMADYKDRQCYYTLLRAFDLIANKRDAGEALQYIKETMDFIIKEHYKDVDKNEINQKIMKSYCNLICIGNSEHCISLAPCKQVDNMLYIMSKIDNKEE